MISIRNRGLLLLLCAGTLISSCEISPSTWEPAILAPLANVTADLTELTDVKDQVFLEEMPAASLGFPIGVPLNLPPFTVPYVGPFQFELSSFYFSVDVDSARFQLDLFNNFPIAIGAGSRIVFRSSPDTIDNSNVVFTAVVPQNVLPGESLALTMSILDATLENELFLYIEDLVSPGGNVVFGNQPSNIRFEISFLRIARVRIETEQALSINYDALVNLQSGSAISEQSGDGEIKLFFTNQVPANIGTQIYFLANDQSTILDSLFDGKALVLGSQTDDVSGKLIQINESVATIPISQQKMQTIEGARYARIEFSVDTKGYPGTSVTASSDLKFLFTVVGDIEFGLDLQSN